MKIKISLKRLYQIVGKEKTHRQIEAIQKITGEIHLPYNLYQSSALEQTKTLKSEIAKRFPVCKNKREVNRKLKRIL